jgi:predicted ribosomally synthesized six-cysteine peptide SCIFF
VGRPHYNFKTTYFKKNKKIKIGDCSDMNRIEILFDNSKKNDGAEYGCMECQSSCQSACKTSCTIGNQNCLQKEERVLNAQKKDKE